MNMTKMQERYYHYQRCVIRLKDAISRDLTDDIVLTAVVKTYEMTIELGWKVMRDFLEYQGTDSPLRGSRDVIRSAFKAYIYIDAPLWLKMIDERNKIVHEYDEEHSRLLASRIEETYLVEFENTATIMKELLDKLE